MKATVRWLGAVLVSLALGSPAIASNWVQAASGCAVDPISTGKITFVAGGVGFDSSTNGQVTLNCNVTNPEDVTNPTWNFLELAFSATGTTRVRAFLVRASKTNAASISTVAHIDSNDGPLGINLLRKNGFTHTFDFFNYSYYVQLVLDRPGSGSVSVNRAALYRFVVAPLP